MRYGFVLLLTSIPSLAAGTVPSGERNPRANPLPQGAVARVDVARAQPGKQGLLRGISLSPTGRYLACTCSDGERWWLRAWEVRTGKLLLERAGDDFSCHAFERDGSFAFLVKGRLFHARTPADPRPREFDKPSHPQNYHLQFAPDGKTLYLTAVDGVQRWEVATGKRIPPEGPLKVWADGLSFSPDGRRLLLKCSREVSLVDLAAGLKTTLLQKDPPFDGMWQSVAFASPSRLLVADYFRTSVRLLNLASGGELRRWEWRAEFGFGRCGLSPRNGPLEVLPHGQMAVHVPTGARSALLKTDNVSRRENVIRLLDLATGGVRHELEPGQSHQLTIVLSPDGRYLASAGYNGNVLVWDLYAGAAGKRLPVESCWDLLASADAVKAYRATCDLVNQPDRALKFLQQKLTPPAPTVKPEQVRRLIRDLDHPRYRVRQAGFDALRKLDREAIPEILQALRQSPTLEVRRRLEGLLAQAEADTPERLRVRRALEALGAMRHPGARRLLGSLARGTPGMFPTQEAADALLWLPR
jgi:hypothetical protein